MADKVQFILSYQHWPAGSRPQSVRLSQIDPKEANDQTRTHFRQFVKPSQQRQQQQQQVVAWSDYDKAFEKWTSRVESSTAQPDLVSPVSRQTVSGAEQCSVYI